MPPPKRDRGPDPLLQPGEPAVVRLGRAQVATARWGIHLVVHLSEDRRGRPRAAQDVTVISSDGGGTRWPMAILLPLVWVAGEFN